MQPPFSSAAAAESMPCPLCGTLQFAEYVLKCATCDAMICIYCSCVLWTCVRQCEIRYARVGHLALLISLEVIDGEASDDGVTDASAEVGSRNAEREQPEAEHTEFEQIEDGQQSLDHREDDQQKDQEIGQGNRDKEAISGDTGTPTPWLRNFAESYLANL